MRFNFKLRKPNIEGHSYDNVLRKFVTLQRVLTTGFQNFFRNAWLSTAATAVMVVTLTLLLTGIIMNLALNKTVDDIASRIDISIFLEDDTTPDQRDELRMRLERLDNVQSVTYVSKLDALDRYREQNRDNPLLLEAVTEDDNPLPASYEVEVYDLNEIEPIIAVTRLPSLESAVEGTSYDAERQETIQRIAGGFNFIIRFSLITSLVFAVISVLIIFNTIRMAVFTRSSELGIMRLIGATNSFIRGPFLFEASLYGVVAALAALGLVYSALFSLGPRISTHVNFQYVMDIFSASWPLVVLGTLAVGVAIGLLSSLLAMMRYLKL